MKRISRRTARSSAKKILLVLALCMLISTTGCSQQRRFVVVDGGETVTVKKSELDRLYQDKELLMQALEECRSGR